MSDEATCSSCGKKIIWIEAPNASGTNVRIPLDARRHPIYCLQETGGEWVRADNARITHFATCPNATQHSKGTKS